MAARVLAVVGAVGTALIPKIIIPVGFGGAALLAIAIFFMRQNEESVEGGRLKLTNPFEIATVFKFGLLLTVITVTTKLLTRVGGGEGVYALAALSGIADVDAMTLSMSRLASDPGSITLAANAVLIVVAVNTVAKAVLGWVTGGADYGNRLLMAAAAAIAAGGMGAYFIPSLS
jgi:uncharacterized membrane protein (DUF4010 family)